MVDFHQAIPFKLHKSAGSNKPALYWNINWNSTRKPWNLVPLFLALILHKISHEKPAMGPWLIIVHTASPNNIILGRKAHACRVRSKELSGFCFIFHQFGWLKLFTAFGMQSWKIWIWGERADGVSNKQVKCNLSHDNLVYHMDIIITCLYITSNTTLLG